MTATAFAAETSQLPAHFLVLVDGDSDGTEFSFWGNANKASRYYARRGHAVEIRPVFARREDEYAYYARPAWDEAALFTELDGMTFADREELSHYYDYLAEAEAEGAWLRAAETNDQYAYEVEQDELRAAAWRL
jgi:hypothetical protein